MDPALQAVAAWLDGDVDGRHGNGMTLLMATATGGLEAMMRLLLQRGASINLQDSDGFTALMYAAASGHTTIVQVLLDAKAAASLQNNTGHTALTCAAKAKQTAAVQLLRQHAERQAR